MPTPEDEQKSCCLIRCGGQVNYVVLPGSVLPGWAILEVFRPNNISCGRGIVVFPHIPDVAAIVAAVIVHQRILAEALQKSCRGQMTSGTACKCHDFAPWEKNWNEHY